MPQINKADGWVDITDGTAIEQEVYSVQCVGSSAIKLWVSVDEPLPDVVVNYLNPGEFGKATIAVGEKLRAKNEGAMSVGLAVSK